MAFAAGIQRGRSLGDVIMKVDHAGEHGAVCTYRVQASLARWRAPEMVEELRHFLAHEQGHRAAFLAELDRRARPRCRSYHLCGFGGFVLGALTGLAGRQAIAATTVAIERVVLRHMRAQVEELRGVDPDAVATLERIIGEEQEHHDRSALRVRPGGFWPRVIDPIVAVSTETVIWMGMRLP